MSASDGRGRPDVEFTFGHDPHAPRNARRQLQILLYSHEPAAASVILAASELVSNVVQHTNSGGVVRAWTHRPIRLEVSDTSTVHDFEPAGPKATGGRGLKIIAEITERWGVSTSDDGKVVWAEFAAE